jgi:tetratricopeptide (TPR) repeat protein
MGQKRRRTDKVIHVVFGPGGGRVESKNQRPPGDETPPLFPNLPDAREPITDLFSGTEVCRLLELSSGRLRSLDRAGIVSPTGRRHGRRAYTFADLIALRTAQALLTRRVRLRDVARAVTALKRSLPKVTRPLAELRVVSDGQRLVVRSHEGSYEPLTGQMLLDLEIKTLRDDVVRVLRPAAGKERSKTAYNMYVRASQLDEDPATMKEAEALYRQALELDPWLAIAYTNLGNICFRKGEEADAEKLYHRALQIDSRQPEAQYNLGYLMLERGRPVDAIPHFLGAIEADPKFADAYFNLAMAYEGIGDAAKARPCWKHYLELEPAGTWAEIARKHL